MVDGRTIGEISHVVAIPRADVARNKPAIQFAATLGFTGRFMVQWRFLPHFIAETVGVVFRTASEA
jgi:hypothetical protein